MRLLSLNNYHYRRGGAETVYFEHTELFRQQGWETAHFAMQHPKNQPSEWSQFFVEEIELGGDYSLLEKATKGIKSIYSLEAKRKLSDLLRTFRPDIAHAHNIYHHISPSIFPVLKNAGIPIVLTAHDLKIACPNYQMQNGSEVCERCKGGNYLNVIQQRCVHGSLLASTLVAVEATLHRALGSYRLVDRIAVPSRFFMDKFVEWGWPVERFAYVPNYVDANAFRPEYTPGDHILFFGRIAAGKGVQALLQAVRQSGVKLRVAGTGPLLESLRAEAARDQLPVEFLGFQSGQALHDVIRAARAVVVPSEWYENAPLSALESFALGKPVIGTRIGGIPELVRPDESGWLVPPSRPAELAEAMRTVMGLPDASVRELGHSARRMVEREFSATRYLDAFVNLYAGLTQSREP